MAGPEISEVIDPSEIADDLFSQVERGEAQIVGLVHPDESALPSSLGFGPNARIEGLVARAPTDNDFEIPDNLPPGTVIRWVPSLTGKPGTLTPIWGTDLAIGVPDELVRHKPTEVVLVDNNDAGGATHCPEPTVEPEPQSTMEANGVVRGAWGFSALNSRRRTNVPRGRRH